MRVYASIAGLLQVNSMQLTLEIATRDRFIIQSLSYLIKALLTLTVTLHTLSA
ncbi:hypothetical protein CZ797_14640 [Pseudoalteromonas sp. JB197]|nr:hypothetical protein CZ797_14640 [Pseudoalteromonas sp. JB197]